jgi:tetratricopeptide (TPR) repeat protein
MPDAFGKIHTKSLAALIAFSLGLDYLDQEKYDEAREAFQKALDEDPKFDLAEQALMETPVTAMLLMTPSQMISSLSVSGFTTASSGSAVVSAVTAVGYQPPVEGKGVIPSTTNISDPLINTGRFIIDSEPISPVQP